MSEKILVKPPESLYSLIQADLPEQPCWMYPGILPKSGMMIFGGTAGMGKSFIMLELQRALSTGTMPFGCPLMSVGDPIKTLMIEQELGPWGLQLRAKEIYQTEDPSVYGERAFYASKVPKLQLDDRDGRDILMQLIESVEPQVLLLDPIGRMQSYDENKSDQIQQLFSHLEYIIDLYKNEGLSIVISHHFGKPGTDPKASRDPLDPYNFRGSSKWFDCPDTRITLQHLKFLDRPPDKKAWEVRMRVITRQDAGLPDLLLSVNRDDDSRVRYEHTLGETVQPMKKKDDKPMAEMPKKQLRFAEG